MAMAMASLPSYQDAVSADWLCLVAPYILPQDYPSLCRVHSRYWELFAPRLWARLPGASRASGRGESATKLPSGLGICLVDAIKTEKLMNSLVRFGMAVWLGIETAELDKT